MIMTRKIKIKKIKEKEKRPLTIAGPVSSFSLLLSSLSVLLIPSQKSDCYIVFYNAFKDLTRVQLNAIPPY